MTYSVVMSAPRQLTIAETSVFTRKAASLLSAEEADALYLFLSLNPEAGEVIVGSGGVRKLRWALPGRGKRGGARIIYYYHGETVPLYLLALYAKNERETLTDKEINDLSEFTTKLKAQLLMKERRQ